MRRRPGLHIHRLPLRGTGRKRHRRRRLPFLRGLVRRRTGRVGIFRATRRRRRLRGHGGRSTTLGSRIVERVVLVVVTGRFLRRRRRRRRCPWCLDGPAVLRRRRVAWDRRGGPSRVGGRRHGRRQRGRGLGHGRADRGRLLHARVPLMRLQGIFVGDGRGDVGIVVSFVLGHLLLVAVSSRIDWQWARVAVGARDASEAAAAPEPLREREAVGGCCVCSGRER
ncbi:hypothetical protein VTK73DRAFT_6023 [Phialemonium thermophilum]|uniref:Uncharacterized protein n=1 Tax=Phialemonium thermophilum TaxID=223376 RepID=A0ABR3V052_9PEZI